MHAKDWLTMYAFSEPSNGHMSSYPDATVAHLDDNRAVDTRDIRGAEHAQANTDLETTAPSTPTMIDGQDPSAPDVSARPLVALLPQQANRIDVLYPASAYLDR